MTAPDPAPSRSPPPPALRRALAPVAWALYLAASWTWCIGMFLPVLLVRDHGVLGFVVFAVPNCLGAAAMGWVLARRARPAGPTVPAGPDLLVRHAPAAAWFSIVTIAFHAFFLIWCVTWLFPWLDLPAVPGLGTQAGPLLAFVLLLIVGDIVLRAGLAARYAAVVWAVSAAFLVALAFLPSGLAPPATDYFNAPDPAAAKGLLFLTPVCVFGFLLCPYLDATFHHAARHSRAESGVAGVRVAFTLGFLVFFAAMILATLFYSGFFAAILDNNQNTLPRLSRTLSILLVVHLLVQAVFTVQIHRERLTAIADSVPTLSRWFGPALWSFIIAGLLLGYFWRLLPLGPSAARGITSGEVVYRAFMSFYGLVFPAYVWICMIPTRARARGTHSGLSGPAGRIKLACLIVAVLLAAPCYWLGFIERQWIWLVPGLSVVLLARLPGMFLARDAARSATP